MIEAITHETIGLIRNPQFRNYAETYLQIKDEFNTQVLEFGLPFSTDSYLDVCDEAVKVLESRGLTIANDNKSFHINWISPSCVTCRKGAETATFLLSVRCPHTCYFCFNPNQKNFGNSKEGVHDIIGELDMLNDQGVSYIDLALTGGEPLIHKKETREFFEHARLLYPDAYTRLYTSGFSLNEDYLHELHDVGLNEIRFSIKTEDAEASQKETLDRIALSKRYIPAVVVEMPVMPDNLAQMKSLLLKLEAIGIAGINLLELCFPFNNADEFAKRGYRLKSEPFRVLYDYWYAGGLPIAGSEENCLKLLAFSLDRDLHMGVHYCSLENKFSGQIYLQNFPHRASFPLTTLSDKDHFLKSAKVFGDDVASLLEFFDHEGFSEHRFDEQDDYLEFPCRYLTSMVDRFPGLEAGIGYYVVEQRDGETVLRELRIDRCHLSSFDIDNDL